MTVKFTQGPWEIEGDTQVFGTSEDGKDWTIATAGEPVEFAGFSHEDLSSEIKDRIMANARLIAAAPDMAEVLYDLIVAYPLLDDQIEELRSAARAALDKAGVV